MSAPTQQQRPTFPPTRPGTLLLVVLAAGVVARWAIDLWYGKLPPLSWSPAITVTGIACGEAVLAFWVRPRVRRTRAGLPPTNPLLMARLAVLAKASAVLGSLVVGTFAGALVWLLPQRGDVSAIADDVPAAVADAVSGGLLVAAALWLEHTCRIPPTRGSAEPPDGVSGADMG